VALWVQLRSSASRQGFKLESDGKPASELPFYPSYDFWILNPSSIHTSAIVNGPKVVSQITPEIRIQQ
jgi:hypothetical protein